MVLNMLYLTQRASGIWYFRYQIPLKLQPLFSHKREIKKSLRTRCRLSARIQAAKLEQELLNKLKYHRDGLIVEPSIPSEFIIHSPSRENIQAQMATIKSESIVDIEEVLAAYRLEKENQNRGMKEVRAVIASCRLVHDFLGSNDMFKVSRDDVNCIIPKIKQYPVNAKSLANKKHFDGLNSIEIIEKNKNIGLVPRKESQAMRDIERASTIYRWAMLYKKINFNPFEGLCHSKSKSKSVRTIDRVDMDKDKKSPFTVEDLKRIFSHPVYTQGKIGRNTRENIRLNYQYWIMLIVLTTGARPNEICQLRVKDVQKFEGMWCFLIQDEDSDQSLKNNTAVRVIPIPDILLNLGFNEYLESVINSRMLFPDLTYTKTSGYYGKVEGWFDRCFSAPMGFKSQSKSLYSLRHTFIFDYQQRGKRCPIVAQLVGHKNGNITDDIYGGRFSVRLLKEKIDELSIVSVLAGVLPFK